MYIYINKLYPKKYSPNRFYQKIKIIICNNKFKTSDQNISINSSPFIESFDRTNVVYMFQSPIGDCVSNVNNTYVGLATTIHLNDFSSIAIHLKSHSIPKSKFGKF